MAELDRAHGWRFLAAWAVSFGLLSFAFIGMMSIGVYILPVAGVAFLVAARRGRFWPEGVMGTLVGVGAVLLWIAFINRDYVPCLPENRSTTLSPGQSFKCGGWSPLPWLLLGLPLVGAGIAGYATWRRRLSSAPRAT